MPDSVAPLVVTFDTQSNGAVSKATLPAPGVVGDIKAPDAKPGEAVKAEAPKETKAEHDRTWSARFADLAKREKSITSERRKLSEERAAASKEIGEAREFAKLKADAKRNPEPYFKAVLGDDWYQLATQLKANGVPPAELLAAALDDKLEAFKSEHTKAQEEAAKKAEEAKAAEDAKNREEFYAEVTGFVSNNVADYKLINLYGSHQIVAQLIEAEQAKTGKLLAPKEAADQVEKFLRGQHEKAAEALGQQLQPDKRNEPPQRRTLSNDMTASAQPVASRRPPTDEERIRNVVARMEEIERARKSA